MKKSTYEAAKQLARELRKQQTPAETFLWNRLRNRQFLGNKFLRQHPIFFYYGDREAFFIADFYCREHKLVIELDGKSHEYQKEYDAFRTHIINDLGIKILGLRTRKFRAILSFFLRASKQYLVIADSIPDSPSLLSRRFGG